MSAHQLVLAIAGGPLELAGHALVLVEEGRSLSVDWPAGALVLLPREYAEAVSAEGHARVVTFSIEPREWTLELVADEPAADWQAFAQALAAALRQAPAPVVNVANTIEVAAPAPRRVDFTRAPGGAIVGATIEGG